MLRVSWLLLTDVPALRKALPRILFFGGDEVSVTSLSTLHQRMQSIAAAVPGCDMRSASPFLHVVCPTAPTDPAALAKFRESQFPVLRYCMAKGLPCHVVDDPRSLARSTFRIPGSVSDPGTLPAAAGRTGADAKAERKPRTRVEDYLPEAKSELDAVVPFDIAVVVSFRYFLPNALLRALPPVVNMHPSLLPRFRGASPIFTTLLRGEREGGASIVEIAPGNMMDAGRLLAQRRLPISAADDIRQYFPAVVQLGADLLADVVLGEKGESSSDKGCWEPHFRRLLADAQPQPDATLPFAHDPFHASLLDRRRSTLHFDTMSGEECHNVWRAFAGAGRYFRPAPNAALDKGVTPAAQRRQLHPKKKKRHEAALAAVACVSARSFTESAAVAMMAPAPRGDDAPPRAAAQASAAASGDAVGVVAAAVHGAAEEGAEWLLSQSRTQQQLTPCIFAEAVHPDLVAAHVLEELDAAWHDAAAKLHASAAAAAGGDSDASTLQLPPPGTAYFPRCDDNVCAVRCAVGWFFWTSLGLREKAPQSAHLIRSGLSLRTGVFYRRLFVSPAAPSSSSSPSQD